MASNCPPKATLSTLGSYSGSLHRIWDHWGLFWCKKEEKLAQKLAQFGPAQELASGVLEARGINRHDFFDYFPPLGTHTKWFMQKKSLARTIKIPRGFTHFECTTVPFRFHRSITEFNPVPFMSLFGHTLFNYNPPKHSRKVWWFFELMVITLEHMNGTGLNCLRYARKYDSNKNVTYCHSCCS